MLLVYLFRNHKLNPLMSSYQVLRNTWLSLCQTDWLTNGLSLAQDSKGNTLLEEFNSNYEVVFVDLTGLVNLTSSVTKVNYIRLLFSLDIQVDGQKMLKLLGEFMQHLLLK
ncbi:nucleolar protein 6-like isoform X6 [Lycorma delicatula]|uniref:nucleolar protein 6-like isoform X6 n=1 Tax=Lycorma delicatula TaxID=130591 RepID=UPI003F51868F